MKIAFQTFFLLEFGEITARLLKATFLISFLPSSWMWGRMEVWGCWVGWRLRFWDENCLIWSQVVARKILKALRCCLKCKFYEKRLSSIPTVLVSAVSAIFINFSNHFFFHSCSCTTPKSQKLSTTGNHENRGVSFAISSCQHQIPNGFKFFVMIFLVLSFIHSF